MQSTSTAGFLDESKRGILNKFASFKSLPSNCTEEERVAIRVQRAWRKRLQKFYLPALKQAHVCQDFRKQFKEGSSASVCACCARGESSGKYVHHVETLQFSGISKMLFQNQHRQNIYDNGENWNQRFQNLLELRETTIEDRIYKYSCLSSLNNDFVEASTLYAKAIISEYYLHVKDKTILDRSAVIGGLAGGEKFLWRGILFKLANGEKTGPWNGNDEYAAKGAGHELKNTIHYYNACSGLIKNIRYPLMALIDYCGFRMVCQAYLPIEGSKSLVYGSNDGGVTITKSNSTFNQYMEVLCSILKLKPHSVGRNRRELVELHGPVDVEGHWGQDGLFYLLDLQRGFPAESPLSTPHLQGLIPTGARVKVVIPNTHAVMSTFEVDGTVLNRRVSKVHSEDAAEVLSSATYDIIIVNKSLNPPKISVLRRIPASDVKYAHMTIFHRLLRPEYVQHRGETVCPLDEANGTMEQEVEYTRSSLVVRKGKGPPVGMLTDLVGVQLEADTSPTPCSDHSTGLPDNKYGLYDSFSDVINRSNLCDAYSDFNPPSAILNQDTEYGNPSDVASPLWSSDDHAHADTTAGTNRWNPRPLSADAMSSFSRFDPEALVHNTEVNAATQRLCKVIIPTVAHLLIAEYTNPCHRLTGTKLTLYLHKQGINMRHLGLLRKCVAEAPTGSVDSAHSTSSVALKEELLNQILSRTLKNLLREFQRKWMKSEQSTSDQGMKILVAQFINLALGSHENSASFWTDQVTLGVYERFGLVALTSKAERVGLFTQVRSIPNLLKSIVMNVMTATGVVIHPIAMERFDVVAATNPHLFELFSMDIVKVEAKVKYLHVIDEINAKLMDEYAQLQSKKSKDVESIDRLERMALFHYDRLLEKIPSTKSISSRYTLLQTNVERRGAGSDHSGSNRNKAMKSFDMDGADPNNDPSWCCLS